MRKITHDNFHIATNGMFYQCKHPNRKPDFITYDRISKKPHSLYWYSSDEGGDYVIRKSDHWCQLNNTLTKTKRKHLRTIKDCRWHISFYPNNFILKRKKFLLKQSFLIGKIYLKNLNK
jgi:hypothetical protein